MARQSLTRVGAERRLAVFLFVLAGAGMVVAGEGWGAPPPAVGGGAPASRDAAAAAQVRGMTDGELSALGGVLRTIQLAVEQQSLPTLATVLSPALLEEMRRASGAMWGRPEFFAALREELRASQPSLERDAVVLRAVSGLRGLVIFRMRLPVPDAQAAEPRTPDLPGEVPDLSTEPMRTVWVLFEFDPVARSWRMCQAREEQVAMDFLQPDKVAESLAEIYGWAGFPPPVIAPR